ncbi:MAG: acyl-CoA synthetase [Rhodospirillaceae bacterium]|jgi:hypothetical protein|nr:acyl-CoA synthetase [Rhodospirillaceae bacterium]MBT3908461.1 acyl-CoA synthetase [Rhodospirillaceae bacterium]MBT5300210.1 acyl-CoA synthetase [Rhodospirillaceae bacterium]MBT5515259.1 acyl-CoA synthetase [Rhodospirillaceae bacterium]MBT6086263.1 acyl-CoA synthetase [Rhodospirillaceae bacterium]
MANGSDGLNWSKILAGGVVLMVMMVISLPTLIVLFIGMLPTGVAAIIDRSEEKYGTFCVGGLNLCGVFPYITTLWFVDHTVNVATGMITDVFTLLVMYASAAFGWTMFMAIPPVIASFLSVMAQTRVKTLRALQREIMEEWGPGVASTVDDAPLDAPPEAPHS